MRYFPILILTFLLIVGCAANEPEPDSPPMGSAQFTATAAAVIATMAASTPEPGNPTDLPTLEPLSATATAAMASTMTAIASGAPPTDHTLVTVTPEAASPAPDYLPLQWEPIEENAGLVQQMTSLPGPVMRVDPSPDGRRWAVMVQSEMVPAGPSLTSLYILDGQGTEHWLASETGNDLQYQHRWLPDGQLVWADAGHAFIANGDGSGRRDLGAPEEIFELWLGANDMALFNGATALWRYNLRDGSWDVVEGFAQNGKGGYAADNLTLSPDGSFAAVVRMGEYWLVPLAPGAPPRLLTALEYPGRGGRINPPYPLANSPYWVIGEMTWPSDRSQPMISVLLDTRDNSVVPLTEFIPSTATVITPAVSPDGAWVAVAEGAPNEMPTSFNLAPSSDLSAGYSVAGSFFLGWDAAYENALIQTAEGDIILAPVAGGEAVTLLREFDLQPLHPVTAVADTIFIGHELELFALAPDGTEKARLDLPFSPYLVRAGAPAQVMLSFNTGTEHALWLWQMEQ